MKILVAALCFGLIGIAPNLASAKKRTTFKVDSLTIELKRRYKNAYRRARLKRSITAKLKKMRRCFVYVVKKNPKYDGYFWVAVTFSKKGRVTDKTITTTVKNNIASECMKIMIDAWRLPRGGVGKAKAQVHIYVK
jgi:hypothetical protein